MSKSKGKRFVLPKPSNGKNLNIDFSSRLEYYDDEKKGILNIVKIMPMATPKSLPKSLPKSTRKSMPKSARKSTPKSNRVMSRT